MKQKLHFLLMGIGVCILALQSTAKQITLEDAKQMAPQVYAKHATSNASAKAQQIKVTTSYTKINKDSKAVSYYIVNFEPTGFAVISAEDNYNAVLAFSDESNIDFDADQRNIGLFGTLSVHEQRIQFLRENQLNVPKAIKKEWAAFKQDSKSAKTTQRFDVVVAPLTTTKWDQGLYYNAQCPADVDAGEDGRTWGGCVPIAMAQLIKFHNYPVSGNGSNSFADAKYGTLTADFCNTTYDWASMPDELTTYNDEVAKLVSHMGIATNTEYSPTYTATYWNYVRSTFVDYFGFDNAAGYFYDSNNYFSTVAKTDLDNGLPLLLSGDDLASGWGHCWVADGYGYFDSSLGTGLEYFHFNWGWRGDNNGWFLDNASYWAALEGQVDVSDIPYYWNRYVLHNIFPSNKACQEPEDLYVASVNENYAFLNSYNYYLDQQIQFRYRAVGAANWTELPITSDFYKYVDGLTPATQYEYQVRRDCCGGAWSGYTASNSFRTFGEGEACDAINETSALDFYALTGYDSTTHDLYLYYYNTDGYQYIYGFAQSCTAADATTFYDCNGNSVAVSSILNISKVALNENECIIEDPDCSKHTGTFFYDYCDDGTVYYFIRTDDNIVYDPYFYEVAQISFAEGTAVNFDFIPYTDFQTCSIATGGGISITCIEYVEIEGGGDSPTFQLYPWLSDIVDPANCNGESIDVYELGSYQFLNIKDSSGNGDLYLSTGVYYCSDAANYNCVNLYGLTSSQLTQTWSCGQTNPNPDPDPEPEPDPTCEPLNSDLYNSYAGPGAIYFYAAQPLGLIQNQFRYRAVGSTAWLYSDISTDYYKYITNLTIGTQYEYQMTQECSAGVWSAYTGSYYITVSGLVAKNSTPLSLNEITKRSLQDNLLNFDVYPNPVSNVLYISNATNETAQFTIYNIAGELVKTVPANSNKIEVSNLNAGVYLLQLNNGTSITHQKFIKK